MGNKYKIEIEADTVEEAMEILRYADLRAAHEEVWNEIFRPNNKHGYGNPILDNGDAHAAIGILAEMYLAIIKERGLDRD